MDSMMIVPSGVRRVELITTDERLVGMSRVELAAWKAAAQYIIENAVSFGLNVHQYCDPLKMTTVIVIEMPNEA